MKKWEIDVPVLITFFVRDEVLEPVFESVRQARPSTLLLWQDGPRANRPDDLEGIKRCREIVDKIDWECTVHRNYHDENMGCDPSTFLAQKWAFSIVDKCIILEDDMVCSQSFFRYCKELLDRYEFDDRINHICGVNFLDNRVNCPDDYLFTYSGTGAWASWKRVAKGWDEVYSFLDDTYYLKQLRKKFGRTFDSSYSVALNRRKQGIAFWETILGFDCKLNNRLVIIPRRNLVSNIGVTENATHGSDLKLMPKRIRECFYKDAEELSFPLKHPKYIVANEEYMDELYKFSGMGHPFIRLNRKIEYIARCIYYGEFKKLFKGVINRIKK